MSIEDSSSGRNGAGVKTLAIRLELDRHAQLTMIAQLRGNTITEELQLAVEAHIATIKSTPEFANQAEAVLAEIEREAVARRTAISALFGSQPNDAAETDGSGDNTPKPRSRKAAGGDAATS